MDNTVTLNEFSGMDIYRKASVLIKEGNYIMDHNDSYFMIQLYALRDFFTEVIISRDTMNVVEIIPFRTGDRLDKYLNKIEIPFITK
jgi:hypothetical protein